MKKVFLPIFKNIFTFLRILLDRDVPYPAWFLHTFTIKKKQILKTFKNVDLYFNTLQFDGKYFEIG